MSKFSKLITMAVSVTVWIYGCTTAESVSTPLLPSSPLGIGVAAVASAQGHPIPIEEAIRVAYEAAKRWRSKVELLTGFSQQSYEEREAIPPPGVDGRRRAWVFEFVDPTTQEFVVVETWDGRVTGVQEAGTHGRRGFDPKEFRVSGAWLAMEAKKAHILPGKGGIAGYQFSLDYNHSLKKYTVTVVGVDEQGKGKRLVVDPRTGEVLSIG